MTDQLAQALSDLEEETAFKLIDEGLASGTDPLEIIASCREGMSDVGKRYESGEYFVSDLIMAGEVFKQAMAKIGDKFQTETGDKKGSVVIGTVKGDIHDIGKDIVVSLLQAGNFDVIDLGVDVPPEKFVEAVKETGATIVGLSGFLTLAYDPMKDTVAALRDAGLDVKIMIGGGQIDEQIREYTSADAYGRDAMAAVALAKEWA